MPKNSNAINISPYEVGGEFNPFTFLMNNHSLNTFIQKFSGDFNQNYYEDFIKTIHELGYHVVMKNVFYYNTELDDKDTDGDELNPNRIVQLEDNEFLYLSNNNTTNDVYSNASQTSFIIVRNSHYYQKNVVNFDMTYLKTNENDFKILYEKVLSYENPVEEKMVYFYRIGRTMKGYSLHKYKINPISVFPEYYNDKIDLEKLQNIVNSDKSGLILFSGFSGSGKTSLIKYLSLNSDKKFVFLTINEIDVFSDPNASEFLGTQLHDSVIILEDCEMLLKSRKNDVNPYISTLLNVGDGLIGQLLNLKVILTYNNGENIDDALLRKGRCIFTHDFKKIDVENSNKVAKRLKLNITFKEPQVLCDIFNREDNGLDEIIKSKPKIGFGV